VAVVMVGEKARGMSGKKQNGMMLGKRQTKLRGKDKSKCIHPVIRVKPCPNCRKPKSIIICSDCGWDLTKHQCTTQSTALGFIMFNQSQMDNKHSTTKQMIATPPIQRPVVLNPRGCSCSSQLNWELTPCKQCRQLTLQCNQCRSWFVSHSCHRQNIHLSKTLDTLSHRITVCMLGCSSHPSQTQTECRVCGNNVCFRHKTIIMDNVCHECHRFTGGCTFPKCNTKSGRKQHQMLLKYWKPETIVFCQPVGQQQGYYTEYNSLGFAKPQSRDQAHCMNTIRVCKSCKITTYQQLLGCCHYICKNDGLRYSCFQCNKSYCKLCIGGFKIRCPEPGCTEDYIICLYCQLQKDTLQVNGLTIRFTYVVSYEKYPHTTSDLSKLVIRLKSEKPNNQQTVYEWLQYNGIQSIGHAVVCRDHEVISCEYCNKKVRRKAQATECQSCKITLCMDCVRFGKCPWCILTTMPNESKCRGCNQWLTSSYGFAVDRPCQICGETKHVKIKNFLNVKCRVHHEHTMYLCCSHINDGNLSSKLMSCARCHNQYCLLSGTIRCGFCAINPMLCLTCLNFDKALSYLMVDKKSESDLKDVTPSDVAINKKSESDLKEVTLSDVAMSKKAENLKNATSDVKLINTKPLQSSVHLPFTIHNYPQDNIARPFVWIYERKMAICFACQNVLMDRLKQTFLNNHAIGVWCIIYDYLS
jgi:hypothetical protein